MTEAEYRALASTMVELMWFMNLLKSIGYCLSPSKLYCYNISVIIMAKNLIFHHRTKHIEIYVHFVRERVASGALLLEHIAGPAQLADILTKPTLFNQVCFQSLQALHRSCTALSLKENDKIKINHSWQ
jgi:hypothetical protein